MSLTRKIALNSAVQIAGKVVSTGFGLLVIGMLTRSLGPAAFGRYAVALAFLQVFGVLVDLGLYIVLLQKLSSDEANAESWASTAFTLRLITASGFLVLAPLIALLTHYPGDVKQAIAIATISTFAVTMNQVLVGIFQKALQMHRVAIAELVGRVVLLVSTYLVVHSHPTVPWVMVTVAAGSVANVLLSFILSRGIVRIRLHLDREKVRTIFREGWPVALSIAFNLVYFKADTLILARMRPDAEVGLYASAYKVLEVLTTFPAMFAGLLTPLLASAHASQDKLRFQQVLQRAVDTIGLLAIPLAVGTGFVAIQVMRLVGGSAYVAAAPALTVLMVATACIFFGNLFANAVVAVGAQRRMLWAYATVAVVTLTGYFIAIPRAGIQGAAWMTLVSELAIALTGIILILRVTQAKLHWHRLARTLLACVPMVILLMLTPTLPLFTRLFLGVAGYVVGLFLTRTFPTAIVRELFTRQAYANRD
ncbi:MAG: flippase [Patescibacteria group bacterium]